MSYYAAHEWSERHQAEPEIPEPAPVRLSVAEHARGADWCIHATGSRQIFAHGSAPTLAAALQAAQEAAQRLGLREVADGWTDGTTSRGYVPERAE